MFYFGWLCTPNRAVENYLGQSVDKDLIFYIHFNQQVSNGDLLDPKWRLLDSILRNTG